MADALCSRCGEPLGPAGGVYAGDVRGVPDACRPCHALMAKDKCAAWLADQLRRAISLAPGIVTFRGPIAGHGGEGYRAAFSSHWTMLSEGDSFHLAIFAADGTLNMIAPPGAVVGYVRAGGCPRPEKGCADLDAHFRGETP